MVGYLSFQQEQFKRIRGDPKDTLDMLTPRETCFRRGCAVASTIHHFEILSLSSGHGAVFEGVSSLDRLAFEGLAWGWDKGVG